MQETTKIGILIALLLGAWFLHVYDVRRQVNKAVIINTTTLTTQYNTKLNEAAQAAGVVTQKLQKDLDAARKDKTDALAVVQLKYDDAIKRLQNRPQRPSAPNLAPAATVGESCTGAQLFREDAGFLTGEAARAEQVIIQRDYYYNAYENARKKIEELNNERNK